MGLAACTKNQVSEVQSADGRVLKLNPKDTLRVSIASEPPTLDWNKATDTTSSHIINNVMDGLVAYDLSDAELRLKPALAASWKSDASAKVWTFELRKDVKWTDGVPFEAQHVIDGWKRLLARETASEYAYSLFGILNAEEFNQGKVPWEKVGVSVTDSGGIRVELKTPMSYFPNMLTHATSFPIRLDVIEKHAVKWTEAGNFVSLGAFKLAAWTHDKEVVLEANPEYYGGKPHIQYVHMPMIQEQATAMNLYDAGRLDFIESIPSTELKKARARTEEHRSVGLLMLGYYGLNLDRPPTNNVHFRRALAHAVDRDRLVQLLDGGQIPMTSWIPQGMFGHEPDVGLKFDLEKAKAELALAGYKEGEKLPKVEIYFNTNEDHQRIAETIQAQWKQNLGLEVELKNQEWKTYLATLKSGPPMVFRFGWLADYPDPENFMSLMTSTSDNNRSKWKNKKYDELVAQGAGEVEPSKRKEIYRQAQKLLVEEDVPSIPLYSGVAHFLVAKRVEGFPINPLRRFEYKNVKLK